MENNGTPLYFLPPVTSGKNLDVIACIRRFDSGREQIYLTDGEGRYTGRAITKNSFKFIWNDLKYPPPRHSCVSRAWMVDSHIKRRQPRS